MSSRLVIDASAAIRIVVGQDEDSEVLRIVQASAVTLAPGLFSTEVANGLWGYVRQKILTTPEVIDSYLAALGLVDDIVPDHEFGVEALAEAARLRHPAYDLIYAILARRTGSALLTCDRRLAKLAKELGVPLALDN